MSHRARPAIPPKSFKGMSGADKLSKGSRSHPMSNIERTQHNEFSLRLHLHMHVP